MNTDANSDMGRNERVCVLNMAGTRELSEVGEC